jgi:hypothetical protein
MRFLWNRKYLPILGYCILAMGIIFALVSERQHTEDTFREIERQRMERVQVLNLINTRQCQEIETLKDFRREEANESYDNLDRNARLLGIKLTQEARDQALKNRNNILARFKEGTCPRLTIK